MIQRNDLLVIDFYKKDKFTGSYLGMRYQIEKTEENGDKHFCVITWPGPYNFASTADELKNRASFPFTEESLEVITDYLNQTYKNAKSDWPTRI